MNALGYTPILSSSALSPVLRAESCSGRVFGGDLPRHKHSVRDSFRRRGRFVRAKEKHGFRQNMYCTFLYDYAFDKKFLALCPKLYDSGHGQQF